jgi:enamine deaminase RidA (YjgF/YER057c/UK114 family)
MPLPPTAGEPAALTAGARQLDAAADAFFAVGEHAGATADKYVRVTVFLASVLFLVGISTHFPVRSARYGLVSVAALLLVFSLAQLVQLPRPPA